MRIQFQKTQRRLLKLDSYRTLVLGGLDAPANMASDIALRCDLTKHLLVKLGFFMCHIYWSRTEQLSAPQWEIHKKNHNKILENDGHVCAILMVNLWKRYAEKLRGIIL